MEQVAARENILGRIRMALHRKTALPFPEQSEGEEVYRRTDGGLALQFEQEFTRLLGKFYPCHNVQEIIVQITLLAERYQWKNCAIPKNLLSRLPELGDLPFVNTAAALDADATLTDCECLVARTGTVVLSSAQETGRSIPVYAPVHLVIGYSGQLLSDIRQSISFLKGKYPEGMPSMVAFTTGPSRTGDIEKTLVVGVHGPREVILFLLPDLP